MKNAMLEKMNKVYFTRLKEYLSEKLGNGTEAEFKSAEIDVKTEISSNISIYSVMADYILESSEKKPDLNDYKVVLVEAIKKDAKFIVSYVNSMVNEYILEKGDKKAVEFKEAFVGQVFKTLNQIEKQNYEMEQEM